LSAIVELLVPFTASCASFRNAGRHPKRCIDNAKEGIADLNLDIRTIIPDLRG